MFSGVAVAGPKIRAQSVASATRVASSKISTGVGVEVTTTNTSVGGGKGVAVGASTTVGVGVGVGTGVGAKPGGVGVSVGAGVTGASPKKATDIPCTSSQLPALAPAQSTPMTTACTSASIRRVTV